MSFPAEEACANCVTERVHGAYQYTVASCTYIYVPSASGSRQQAAAVVRSRADTFMALLDCL